MSKFSLTVIGKAVTTKTPIEGKAGAYHVSTTVEYQEPKLVPLQELDDGMVVQTINHLPLEEPGRFGSAYRYAGHMVVSKDKDDTIWLRELLLCRLYNVDGSIKHESVNVSTGGSSERHYGNLMLSHTLEKTIGMWLRNKEVSDWKHPGIPTDLVPYFEGAEAITLPSDGKYWDWNTKSYKPLSELSRWSGEYSEDGMRKAYD